jgi:hypothetical protein
VSDKLELEIPECPKCCGVILAVERRPNGDAKCVGCGWHGPYAKCFGDSKNLNLKEQLESAELKTTKTFTDWLIERGIK